MFSNSNRLTPVAPAVPYDKVWCEVEDNMIFAETFPTKKRKKVPNKTDIKKRITRIENNWLRDVSDNLERHITAILNETFQKLLASMLCLEKENSYSSTASWKAGRDFVTKFPGLKEKVQERATVIVEELNLIGAFSLSDKQHSQLVDYIRDAYFSGLRDQLCQLAEK